MAINININILRSIKNNKALQFFNNWNYNVIPVLLFIVLYFLFLNYMIDYLSPRYIDTLIVTIQIFSFATIFGIAALSLNLEIGHAGLTNFGKVAFIMVGSYATGFMMMLGYNILIAFFVGILVSGLFGYLVSIPTLNLREDYLAIVTIVIGEILRTALNTETWFAYPQDGKFGGSIGIQIPNVLRDLISPEDFVFGSIIIANNIFVSFMYVILLAILLVAIYLLVEIFHNSPWGRVLKGIRENDLGAESLGKDIVSYKRSAFILSSAIAGFAGGLWVLYIVHFAPGGFMPILTFNLWIVVILGGLGNNRGVIVGTFIFWSLEGLTRLFKTELTNNLASISNILDPLRDIPFVPLIQDFINIDPISGQNISFGIILIIFLIYRPQGIIPETPIKTVANEYVKNEIAKENIE